MKSWKKIFFAAAIIFTVGFCTNAFAQVGTETYNVYPDNPQGYENLWNCMTRKLGRGVSNVAFGVLEIPIQIYNVNFNEGGIAACTYGLISGLGYFVVREVVGVVEIVTFPIPLPDCPNDPYNGAGAGYGPILKPEWIITPETNLYNFVYPYTPTNM